MRILNYIFWKITRYRLKKDGFNITYWKALLMFGVFFIGFPLIFINPKILNIDIFTRLSKPIQYLFSIPFVCLSVTPFWIIFPKEKIQNLNYSDDEKKKYNRKILFIFLFF